MVVELLYLDARSRYLDLVDVDPLNAATLSLIPAKAWPAVVGHGPQSAGSRYTEILRVRRRSREAGKGEGSWAVGGCT